MIDRAIEARVTSVCEAWEGTPYMRGQRFRGVAVDCANFVCAALDELGTYPAEPVPASPPALLGAAASAEWHIAAMMRRYPNDRLIGGEPVEAGDVIFVATGGGAATHAMLAAGPGLWFHAMPGAGVCRAGAAMFGGLVERVYRPREKHLWIR